MRVLSLSFILLASLLSPAVDASIVSVTNEISVEKSPDRILQILRDHENTCHSGCLYKMTNLQESKLIEKTDAYEIVWQKISGIRETKQFILSTLEFDNGTYRWISKYPDSNLIKDLEQSTGLEHTSTFNSMTIDWELREEADENFTKIKVTMSVDHTLSAIGDPIVKNSIEKTIRTLFYNFRK